MAGKVKLQEVTSLVQKLTDDLTPLSIPRDERLQLLEKLKILGRDPNNADPIFTEEGISMLLQYAFHNEDRETSRGALRVLANSMLLKPHTRQTFIDKDYAPVACSKLNTDSWDDEFLLSRVLFLSTYGTANFKDLVQKHDIGESIGANLGRHEAAMSSKAKENAMMENMALDETLRLLFNITHFCPDDTSEFASAVSPVVALLWRDEISSNKPLGGVPGHLINALLNLDLKDPKHHDALFSREDPSRVASRLIELLGAGLKSYNEQEIGASLPPLVHVLERVYEQAPDDVKKIIRDALLPSDEDRKEVLGKGSSTSALLLKNATNAMAPELRAAITHLFFNMSDKDATKFINNIGFGIASGYLMEHQIPIPPSATEGTADGPARPVNPITGQFIDAERPVDEPEWTEEEKEREAERLFVLFERLKATGVMDVQNPVEAMMRGEGQYRELKDDEVEELD